MSEASISLPRAIPRQGPIRLAGDDRLVRLAAEGNERAFATIYERHHQGLYRYCRSILGDDQDAQDALQNTMLKALRALPGERRELALKPWLYRVAHNEAISVLRRRGADASIEDLDEVPDARGGDAATRERLRTLVSDLAELPERQRSALVMRELSGLSYREIGAALETSPAAAKQAVYEAREGLYELSQGREMECEAARRSISERDRRILRGRRLRAHLRSCGDCRTFEHAIRSRRADLAALAPPLPAGAAAALLEGIVGGGGGTGGGLLGVLTGVAGKSAAGSLAVKATTAVVTVAVGVGTYEIAEHGGSLFSGSGVGDSAVQPVAAEDAPGSHHGGAVDSPGHDGWATGGGADGHAPSATGNAGSQAGAPGQGHGPAAPGHSESASHGIPPGHGGTPPGHGGSPPGVADGAPTGDGGSPPGLEGEVPPSQGGTPPGLDGGTPPGLGGTPPGLGGTPPGLNGGSPPGLGGTPPGLGGTPPGWGNKPPT
jgi:RNA polymerase sigma factor (sigma-70 family)